MKLLCINVPKIYITLFFVLVTYSILLADNNNLLLDEQKSTTSDNRSYSFLQSREGEFLVDTTIAYSWPLGNQMYASIAFDGINYFIVWADDRAGTDIFGSRINQSCITIDSAGIPFPSVYTGWNFPSLAFDSTYFFIVWSDSRGDSADIYGARIDVNGNIIDSNGIPISTAIDKQLFPSVTCDGVNFFVVWQDARDYTTTGWNIYGARVNQSGTVLDPNGIAISGELNDQAFPACSFDGINYMVVWEDNRPGTESTDIYAARIDQTGTILDPSGTALSSATNGQTDPAIAFDGSNYLVVWQDDRNYATSFGDIYGSRVTQSGIVLDPAGISICCYSGPDSWPSIAFDGTNYFAVWQNHYIDWWCNQISIVGVRIDQTGTVLYPITFISYPDWYDMHRFPAVVHGDSNYLAVWSNENSRIHGARITESGVLIDTTSRIITSATVNQEYPSTAYSNTSYLVVWHEYHEGRVNIYGLRVNDVGMILDSVPIAIVTTIGNQRNPDVIYGNTDYFVVWQHGGGSHIDIYGARVDANGNVLDTNGIAISTATFRQEMPSIAFDGTNYLVVWQDQRNAYVSAYDIYGTRVTESGVVLDSNGIAITTNSGFQITPSIAFDGTNYFAVWDDNGNSILYGARIDTAGIVLDTNGIPICTVGATKDKPSVAFDGTNYLVVWQQGVVDSDIYGARVSQAGIVLDTQAIAISTAPGKQSNPTVAYDGIDYLVIWEDERTSYKDIYGAKVSTSGSVIGNYAVVLQAGEQVSPSLTRGVSDQILLTYSGWTDSILSHPAYAMRIWGKFYPFVGIEENLTCVTHSSQNLLQTYPNPTYKQCDIQYTLFKATNVRITIYDVTGRMTKEIVNCEQHAGSYQQRIDMSYLAPGVYFIRLETNKGSETEKVIYLK